MRKTVLILLGLVVIVLVLIRFGVISITPRDAARFEDITQSDFSYSQIAVLEDVGGFRTYRGLVFGEVQGGVEAGFDGSNYQLSAVIQQLPDPTGTDYYEGWIVRRGFDESIVSIGRLERMNEIDDPEKDVEQSYVSFFKSKQDYSDHSLYIVSLELEDGDPELGHLVLQGELQAK